MFFYSSLYGQSKFNIVTGAGITEIYNLGVRYEFSENSQLGISI